MAKPKSEERSSSKRAKTNPSYRKAIVTFIDILGFRGIVKNKTATEVLKMVGHLHQYGQPEPIKSKFLRGLDYPKTFSYAFSDNIVRIRPLDQDREDSPLYSEIYALVHAQAELANEGILIRGGVSFGDIYFNKTQMFGPALNTAYEYESQHAKSPRIVIDPNVFSILRKDPKMRRACNDVASEIQEIRQFLKRSDDGLWFVDYAYAIRNELTHPEYYPEFLSKQRKLISDGLKEFADSSHELTKYLWLARYHNDVVRAALRRPPSELLLSRDDSSALDDLADRSKDTLTAEEEAKLALEGEEENSGRSARKRRRRQRGESDT